MKKHFSRGPWLLASAGLLAVLVTPMAFAAGEGRSVKLGERNPSRSAAVRETEIIARTAVNVYGTRQSNLGLGGGAIYGCRAVLGANPADPKVSTPCVRINNLANGLAFQFVAQTAPTVGVIQSGTNFATPNPNARPFITNATGVATGLNSDKLDGRDAEQIIAEARQANPAADAPSFAYARVGTDAKTDASRSQGVTDANVKKTTTGVYCFYGLTSRPKNAQATLDGVPGEIAVDTTSNTDAACPDPNVEVIVRTFDSAGTPADKPFQLTLTA